MVVILLIYLFTVYNSIIGAQCQWNGSVNTDWNTVGNWSPNIVPGADDTALFNSSSINCVLSSDITLRSIIFTPGYTAQFTMGNKRVTVSGDIDFLSGGNFVFTTYDTLVLNSSNLHKIVGKPGTFLPYIIKDGTGTLEVNTFGFKTMGLLLSNGILSNATPLGDTVNGDLKCTGGQINLNDGSLTIVGNADFSGIQNFSDTTGIISFSGTVNQYVKSNPLVRFPAIEKLSSYELIFGYDHFRARSLKVMYGQARIDTTFNIDSIQLFPGSMLMLNTAPGGHDTVRCLIGNGNMDMGNSELCFAGTHLDLSTIPVLTGGPVSSLTFIGTNQTFTPSTYFMYSKVRRKGTGVTTVTTNGLRVDTLELISGEFNLGNALIDSVKGAIKMMGGILNFSNSTLKAGAQINLNGPGAIIAGSGRIEFSGFMDHQFVPRIDGNNPNISISSMTTHVIGNQLRAKKVDIYSGTLEMDTSFSIDTLFLGTGTILRSDSAVGNSDTVNYIMGSGYLELRNSEMCFKGNQIDLNTINSISGGSLAFIGSNQMFTPSTYFMYSKIRRKGNGITTVTTNNLRVDTLELISGEFNLGNWLVDSLGSSLKMMGGTLNFGNSKLRTGTASLAMNGAGTIIPSNGGIEFMSMGTQNFIPPPISVLPTIQSSSYQLHIKQNRLHTNHLQVNSGSVILDTTVSADTLDVNYGASLMFDTIANQKDTIGNINGNGMLTFGKTTITIHGDANFSYFTSFSGIADIEFSSLEDRSFIPNNNFLFNKIKKTGNNILTINAHGLRVNSLSVLGGALNWSVYGDTIFDTLYVKNATMNLGTSAVVFRSLIDSNSVINFNYGMLIRSGSNGKIDLSAATDLTWNYGKLNFEGNSGAIVSLIPSPTHRLPPIFLNGNDTVKINGNFNGSTIFQNNGEWDWGNNFNHTVHSVSVYGGIVAFGNSQVAIDSADLMLESVSNITSGDATIKFNAVSGIQTFTPPSSSSIKLPDILKSDTSTLQLMNHEVRCHSFRQTAGKIAFSGFGIIADSNIAFENADSLLNLGGVTLQAGQTMRFSGASGRMINCNPTSQWFINVPGNLRADNAIIGNCIVSGTNGIAYPPYVDAGGNSNWVFWVDTFPPDNHLIVNLQALDTGRVRIWWNPGSIDSSDAEIVGIRYSNSKVPDSINDVSTTLLGYFNLIDSVDTVIDLHAHTTYYFAAAVKDTSGNWSEFTANSKKSIRTKAIAPYGISAPDTVHKQSLTLSWTNPPGLNSTDSIFIHSAAAGSSSWNLSSKLPSSQTAATIALPALEGQYRYMISTSQDSAGFYYTNDVFIDTVTYSVTPPFLLIPKDTFYNYYPYISWKAPAGFGSTDSFFVFSDTITGKNTWTLNGQYPSIVLSHRFPFNNYGIYKIMVSTNWDKFGTVDPSNVVTDTLIVKPSTNVFTWDISSDSGIQTSNGIWGSDRFWSNDGKTLTKWLGIGNTACFSAPGSQTIIGVNGIQYADSLVFTASGYKLSGGTLLLSTGRIKGTAVDTINSIISSKVVSKTGSGEIVITEKTQCDTLNVFDGTLTVNTFDTGSTMIPGVLSIYSRFNGCGRIAKKVITQSSASFTLLFGSAGKVLTDELFMSVNCTLNVDIGTRSDTLSVKNAATVNGNLNISSLQGFGKGAYPIITCAGAIIDSGIKIVKTPNPKYTYKLKKENQAIVLYVDTLILDTIKPKIKIDISNGSSFQQMPVAISGTARDSISGLLSISLLVNKCVDSTYWNGTVWQKGAFWIQVLPENQWSYSLSNLNSSDGRYIVKVGATDSAGNMAYDTAAFIVETKKDTIVHPPENLIQTVITNIGDSLTTIQLKNGNIENVQIIVGLGVSKELAEQNVKMLPNKDTVISFRTVIPGKLYCAYAVSDLAGNRSSFNYDSIKINNTPPRLQMIPDTIIMERSTLVRTIQAYDINNDSLSYALVNPESGMNISGTVFKWTPGVTDIGSHSVVIECRDVRGATVFDTFNIIVKDVPEAPEISYSGKSEAFEDSSYEGTIKTSDPDIADTTTVTIVKLPTWMRLSDSKLTGIPRNDDVGIHSVELIYTDKSSLSDTLAFQIKVINTNDKPELISTTILDSVTEKQKYTFDIKITDVDENDSITIKSLIVKSWLKVSSVKRADNGRDWTVLLSCTPVQTDTGLHELKFEIADKASSVVYLSKKIRVLDNDDPPAKPVLVRKNANGAVQINVTATDDRDQQLLYSVKLRDLKNDSLVFRDSSVRNANIIYPLPDGKYELKAIAIDAGGLKSVETIDTFLVTGASEYVLKDTGWSMLSIPSKNYPVSNLKNTRYLLNWDESGVEKQVYSYYRKKEEITDIEGAKAYWRNGLANDTIRLDATSFVSEPITRKLNKTVSGWNQISSPYPYRVAWPRKSDVLWRWNSQTNDYEEVQNVLEPWAGYWVRVDTAASVTLSPVPVFSTGTLAKLRKCYFQNTDNWTLQVSIRTEGGSDVDNKFGFNQNALDRYDELDRPEPPEFEGRPVLYFNREDWKTSCKEFASDIRKNWKSVNIFEFVLSGSREKENGVLSFDGLESTRNLYVFTKIGDSLVQVKSAENFMVPLSKSKSYQTVFVTDNAGFLLTFPLHFKMGNPYPNPFCPATRINYTLPYRWAHDGKFNLEPYTVTIDIYDILGRKLRNLVYRKMTPGNYSVMWNGKSETGRIVASGKYYCVLKADDLKQIRNLTLIK